jgi:hypothetical protein
MSNVVESVQTCCDVSLGVQRQRTAKVMQGSNVRWHDNMDLYVTSMANDVICFTVLAACNGSPDGELR